MKLYRRLGVALVAAGALVAAAPAPAQEKLIVWWVKGFYKSEDDALFEAIKKFEAKTGVKVELSQYAAAGHDPEDGRGARRRHAARRRLRRRLRLPGHRQVGLRRQARGRLRHHHADARTSSCRAALETTFLYNDKTKKKAYYAFPIKQQTMHIQYWKDMLTEAGFKESDIPTTWKEYWDFWCDKVQPAHRKKTGKRTFAIGQPMGVDSSDSFYSFLTFMDAYNVKLVNDNGKLLVDDPKVRRA